VDSAFSAFLLNVAVPAISALHFNLAILTNLVTLAALVTWTFLQCHPLRRWLFGFQATGIYSSLIAFLLLGWMSFSMTGHFLIRPEIIVVSYLAWLISGLMVISTFVYVCRGFSTIRHFPISSREVGFHIAVSSKSYTVNAKKFYQAGTAELLDRTRRMHRDGISKIRCASVHQTMADLSRPRVKRMRVRIETEFPGAIITEVHPAPISRLNSWLFRKRNEEILEKLPLKWEGKRLIARGFTIHLPAAKKS
jgi:hypothetical protein